MTNPSEPVSPDPLPPQPDPSKYDEATKRRSDDNANNPPISDRTAARDSESAEADRDRD